MVPKKYIGECLDKPIFIALPTDAINKLENTRTSDGEVGFWFGVKKDTFSDIPMLCYSDLEEIRLELSESPSKSSLSILRIYLTKSSLIDLFSVFSKREIPHREIHFYCDGIY